MQLILPQHDLKVVADFLETDEASAQDFAHFFEWSELGKGHALAHHSRRQIADDLVDQIRIKERPGLTHFAVADEQDQESQAYTRRQFDLFCRVIRAVEEKRGMRFPLRHCANTGATACYPEMHLDMVRPGLLLYGYGEFAQRLDLRPVMTLKTTISTTKTYEPGTSVSYGRLFTTQRRTRMGVVPYGYADGFFRCLSDRCSLMTAKGPAPQRGRICMDMSMIDLTDLPGVDVGDEVEIFGPHNPVEVMAAQAGTIPYELTCAVSKRVPRVYLQNGQVTERELLLRF